MPENKKKGHTKEAREARVWYECVKTSSCFMRSFYLLYILYISSCAQWANSSPLLKTNGVQRRLVRVRKSCYLARKVRAFESSCWLGKYQEYPSIYNVDFGCVNVVRCESVFCVSMKLLGKRSFPSLMRHVAQGTVSISG